MLPRGAASHANFHMSEATTNTKAVVECSGNAAGAKRPGSKQAPARCIRRSRGRGSGDAEASSPSKRATTKESLHLHRLRSCRSITKPHLNILN